MMIWYIAQISGQVERRTVRGLRDNGFTVVQPCLTVWKPVAKGIREKVKAPMFPGYIFVGRPDVTPLDRIHDPRTPIRLIPNGWSQTALARLVCDFAFRELAGEFDKTGEAVYRAAKPMVGPLNRSLGHGMSVLKTLLTLDERGRLDLLTSGEMLDAPPLETDQAQAA